MAALRLIFDLDDTLYPERSYAIGGFRAAATWASRELSVPDLTDDLTRLLDEGHLGRSFGIALAAVKPDHTPEHLKAMLKAYGAHTPDLALFDDAAHILDHYTTTTLGLITDGHDKTQLAKVSALGIAPRFREVVYTGSLGPDRAFHKPHPRAFELMQAALRQSASDRFVYVGDNPSKDFIAPNSLGWTTIMVDRPHHRPHRIHPLGDPPAGGAAHHTITTLLDLPDALATPA
jgi:putative hydrolase of the HAD superfamily